MSVQNEISGCLQVLGMPVYLWRELTASMQGPLGINSMNA